MEHFPKCDFILGHKSSLDQYRKIETVPCNLSEHNGTRLQINSKNNHRKHLNSWKLNNTLLNDEGVIERIKKENKIFLKSNENDNTMYQNPHNKM